MRRHPTALIVCLFFFTLFTLVTLARREALAGGGGGGDLAILGAAHVAIGPSEAVAAGASFEIDGGALLAPGTLLDALVPGHHIFRFQPLPGWIEPPEEDLVIVGGALRELSFDYQPLPDYYFKSLPPFIARSGPPLRISVRSSDPNDPASPPLGAKLVFEAVPKPKGPISFDPATGELRYQVDFEDRRDFTISFSGTGPTGPVVGRAVITPAPTLPPESAVLHFERPLPDPLSKDYIQIRELASSAPETFNWLPDVHPRSVSVSGRTLIFEAGSPVSDLHARYDGDTDIAELTLYAETVIFRSPFSIPGARVEIRARELRFEGSSYIDVTPLDNINTNADPLGVQIWLDPPNNTIPDPRTRGADGANGISAGSVAIYVETLHSDPDPQNPAASPRRFILRGGNAQDAGNGRNGRDIIPDSTNLFCGSSGGVPIIYLSCTLSDGTIDSECGSQAVYGENGISSGMPGKGGAGGDFTSPWTKAEISSLLEQGGGHHGQPGISVTGGVAPGHFAIVKQRAPPNSVDCTSSSTTIVSGSRGGAGPAPVQPCACYPIDPTEATPCACLPPGEPATCDEVAAIAVANCQGDCADLPRPAPCLKRCAGLGDKARTDCLAAHPDGKLCEDLPVESLCSAGKTGWTITSPDHGAWLHPLVVRSVLLYVKDAYLNEQIPAARALLEEYRVLIAALKGGLPAGDEADEFFQLYQEIESLLHRIDANLDYFGNPVTWVPMLSFEANYSAFKEEIDRAIPILYLARWVQRAAAKAQATRDGAIAAKGQLSQEIDAMIVEHATAEAELPALTAEMPGIVARETALTGKLALLESDLEQRAQQNIEDRVNLPGWKKGIAIIGALAKAIPLYQPALGYVGTGLSFIAQADPDHPLAKVNTLPDLFNKVKSTPYTVCADGKAKEAKTDPKNEKKETLFQRFSDCKPLINQGVDDIRKVLKEVQAPKTEVDAELEKLRATDPVFTEATAELTQLNAEKQQLTERITSTFDKLSKISSSVEEDRQAIDHLDLDLTAALDVLDPRSISYVADMGRRTADRLLEYQYLMAKAYQYRTLKPYTGNLQLGRILDQIESLLEFQSSVPILSPDQFDALKGIFLEELGRIGHDIVTDLNVNTPEHSAPVSFRLTADELAALNDAGWVEIDLSKKGLFGVGEEDLRIDSITTQELAVTQVGTIGTTATLRLRLEHSGISRLTRDGQSYLFTHYRTERVNPITWTTVYDGLSRTRTETEISAANDSLLRVLLNLGGSDDILLYSLPGAMAKLRLSKEVTADTNVDFHVDGLTLKLQYDYATANSGLRKLTVEASDELAPRILLDQNDANGRRDGLGSFVRSFPGPGTALLEAPPSHGAWTFDHWELDGAPQGGSDQAGGGAAPSRLLSVTLGASRTARAIYRTGQPIGTTFRRGDADGDGKLDLTDAVNSLTFLFLGGLEIPCQDAADTNDDGKLDVTDAVVSLGFLFLGTEAPAAPGPNSCGVDPTADGLPACVNNSCP